MTSYQIAAHVGREVHPSYLHGASSSANGTTSSAPASTTELVVPRSDGSSSSNGQAPQAEGAGSAVKLECDLHCVFCRLVHKQQKAYIVWEDEQTIAFLDLMPIRRGHTLLIPKTHCPRISDLDPKVGASIGAAIPQITNAITKAMGNPDLNVVLNQGYAQAVFHAHFHLIPAPHPSNQPPKRLSPSRSSKTARRERKVSEWTAAELQANPPSHGEMLRGETEARSGYLSDMEGVEVSAKIRACL